MRAPASAALRSAAAGRLRLHGWRHPSVVGVALLAVMAGFGQYSVTASLPDIADTFGEITQGASIAERAGLTATSLGLGLALIRLASLATLPISGVADHLGRRRIVLAVTAGGLALTAAAALAPSYWWFVALAALARPQFSAANAVGGVIASEETAAADRSKAIALTVAGYGVGVGVVAVARWALDVGAGQGFRVLFGSAVIALLALPLVARMLGEPDRFVALRARRPEVGRLRSLTSVAPSHRRRLLLLATVTVGLNLVTGPVNTFVFLYAESILGIDTGQAVAAVVVAGPLGFVGLLIGRRAADAVGRRGAAIASQLLIAVGGIVAYSGSPAALLAGYWLSVTALGAYGPPMGALSAEVFPTSMRATAAGWLTASSVLGAVVGLLAFGIVTDVADAFLPAAVAVCTVCALTAACFSLLPETRGLELEQTAPEPT